MAPKAQIDDLENKLHELTEFRKNKEYNDDNNNNNSDVIIYLQ